MGATRRRKGPALIESLAREPEGLDFFQAVRLLEASARERGNGRSVPVGGDGPPAREAVRFEGDPSLAHPVGGVRALHPARDADPARMRVDFLTLVGACGALPQHYTEHLLRRVHLRDAALRDFLDMLHHRALSLFYRAGCKYAFPFAGNGHTDDPVTDCLYSLVGLGTPALRSRQAVDDRAWIRYGGLFARPTRTAVGLEGMLADAGDFPVHVEQHVGRWVELPPPTRTRLSASAGDAAHNRLGAGALLGERVWDVQSKVRIHVGPLTLAAYRRVVPGSDGYRRLCALTRAYVGPDIEFELRFRLADEEAPPARLATRRRERASLGRIAWLRARSHDRLPRAATVVAGAPPEPPP